MWAVIVSWLAMRAYNASRQLKTQITDIVEHRLNYKVCIRNATGNTIDNIQILADHTKIDVFNLKDGTYKLVEFKPEHYRTLVIKSGSDNSENEPYATNPRQLETQFYQLHSYVFSTPSRARYMPGLDYCMLYKPWFESLDKSGN